MLHAPPAVHNKDVYHCLIRLLVDSWTSLPSYLTNVVCVCMLAGETMISGYTGEAFRTDIFIGPVYYQRLRHMVSDKFQVCSASAASMSSLAAGSVLPIHQPFWKPVCCPCQSC